MPFTPFKNLKLHTANFGMSAFPPKFKNKDWEGEMKRELFLENKVKTRIALVMGMIALVVFAVIGNTFSKPEVARQLTILRIGFDLTFLILVFGLTYTNFGQKHFYKLLGTAIIWVSVTINLSNFVDETPIFIVQFYPALMLLLFFGYVFIRGNWYTAIATGALVQIVFLTLSLLLNLATSTFVVSNIYILTANMVGAVGNYILEYSTRREFWTRKQLEAEQSKLEQANQVLDDLVNLRTLELETSNAFMTNLTNGVASDLSAPVRSARGYFELLIERNQDALDETSLDFVDGIRHQSNRMIAMMESLIEYSRLQDNQYRHTNVDGNMVTRIAIQGLKEEIQKTDAKITILPLPSVFGDETQLILLMRNLLSNGLRFHGKNPPDIKVDSHYLENENKWKFSISDKGIGITKPDQTRLFEFFTRIHPEIEFSGIGMGLSICKRIVELHGGKIWVDSTPGMGSTFNFTLIEKQTEDDLDEENKSVHPRFFHY